MTSLTKLRPSFCNYYYQALFLSSFIEYKYIYNHKEGEEPSILPIGLSAVSEFDDFVASLFKGFDACLSDFTLLHRPLEKAFQVFTNVVDGVQIKEAVGAKNGLFKVLL